MSRTAKTLFIASLILTIIGAFGQHASFLDDPPSDYFSRASMDDCVQRFYSEPEKIYLKVGVYRGSRVYRGDFQHMVAIGWIRPNGKIDYLCGGTLITDDFVLTAAHCAVDHDNIAPNTVRIGDTDLGSEEDDEYAQEIEIGRIIVHPQYRGSRKYYDLALIQLAEPIKYSRAVCPASLWREPSLPSERMHAISFAGRKLQETVKFVTLMRKKIAKIEQSSCDEKLRQFNSLLQMPDIQVLRDDQFCVQRNFSTNGDTGGPIVVKKLIEGRIVVPVVVGISSFDTWNMEKKPTEFYTKISSHIDWIEREVNQTLCYEECSENFICPRLQSLNEDDFAQHNHIQRFGLIWDDTAPSLYECGATLIDYQYLLTSASCVTTNRGNPSYVSYDGKERIAVEDVYVSPKYVRGRPTNDVALVKIAKFANPRVHRPSCLWNRRTDGEWSTRPIISAYGIWEPSWNSSEWVNSTISIRPQHKQNCKPDRLRGSELIRCNSVSLPPLCSLDYGGPVTNCRHKPKVPNYIYGIVSSLSKNCGSTLVITDVTPHIVWIEDIIISGRYRSGNMTV